MPMLQSSDTPTLSDRQFNSKFHARFRQNVGEIHSFAALRTHGRCLRDTRHENEKKHNVEV